MTIRNPAHTKPQKPTTTSIRLERRV